MVVAIKRLWIQLLTDKRRLGALTVGLALGLLLWARVIAIAKMPRQAVADPVETESAEVSAETSAAAEAPLRIVLREWPERNPFVISPTHFPESAPVNDLPPDEGKSEPEPVEDQEQTRARMLIEFRALVDRFTLEAVMTGSPMAVISGKTYRLGDFIPAIGHERVRFQLVEVRSRSVLLAFEEHRLELKIADESDQE